MLPPIVHAVRQAPSHPQEHAAEWYYWCLCIVNGLPVLNISIMAGIIRGREVLHQCGTRYGQLEGKRW